MYHAPLRPTYPCPPPVPRIARFSAACLPREFLARHWQKRPLLVRGAWPGFRDPVSVSDLFRLAALDDCESRVVEARRALGAAPRTVPRRDLRRLPDARWTLLVQGLNHFVPAADRMMRAFAFAPVRAARRRDGELRGAPTAASARTSTPTTCSCCRAAAAGAGASPTGGDRALDPRAPLKMLTHFRAEREWVLEPGDMLYLPPGVAHDGIALEPCFTYSIGFRAPSVRELGTEFLAFLQDRLALPDTLYADPDLRPARAPARLDDALVARAPACSRGSAGRAATSVEFIGRHLSEPKPHVRFAPPRGRWPRPRSRAPARDAASRSRRRRGCFIAAHRLFVNGEGRRRRRPHALALVRLADRRALPPGKSFTRAALALLYTWYRAGYLAQPGGHDSAG